MLNHSGGSNERGETISYTDSHYEIKLQFLHTTIEKKHGSW